MTRTVHFQVVTLTKAGTVNGTLSMTLDGPVDGVASVDERLTKHLLASPVEVTPAVVEVPCRSSEIFVNVTADLSAYRKALEELRLPVADCSV